MSWRWWACEVIRALVWSCERWLTRRRAIELAKQNKTNFKKNKVVSYCLLFRLKRSFGRTKEGAASVPPTSPSSINTPERVAPLMSDNELLHRRKRGTILLKGTFASASRKEDRLLQSAPNLPASLFHYGGLKTLQLQEYRTIWPLDTVSKPNEARTRRIYSLWSSGREKKKKSSHEGSKHL